MKKSKIVVAILMGCAVGLVSAETYTLPSCETWDDAQIAEKNAAYTDVVVGAGLSLTLDVSGEAELSPKLAGEGDIVKQGDGTLTLKGVSTFTGELKILDGVLRTNPDETYAGVNLGNPSKVTVADGATLDVSELGGWDSDPILLDTTPVLISGAGHNGQGAIRRTSGTPERPVFKQLHLAADATVAQEQTYKPTFWLDGKSLTLVGSSGLVDLIFGKAGMHSGVGESGSVILETAMNIQGDSWSDADAVFDGTAGNMLCLRDNSRLTISRKKVPIDWTLLVEGVGTIAAAEADQWDDTAGESVFHPEFNTWNGPVVITNTAVLQLEADEPGYLLNFTNRVLASNGGSLTFVKGAGTLNFNGGISLRQSKPWDSLFGRLMTRENFSGVVRIAGDSDVQAFDMYSGRVEFHDGTLDGVGGGLASFYMRSSGLTRDVATLCASNVTFVNAQGRYLGFGDSSDTYGVVELCGGTVADVAGLSSGDGANAGGAIYHRDNVNVILNSGDNALRLANAAGTYAYYGMSSGVFQNNGSAEIASEGFAFFHVGGGTYRQKNGATLGDVTSPTMIASKGGEMVFYQTGGVCEAQHKFAAETADGARMLVVVEGSNAIYRACGAGWCDRLGFACLNDVMLILAANEGGVIRTLRLNRDESEDRRSKFYVSVNGGVIQPTGSDDFFETGDDNASGPDAVYVHEGGMTLDTSYATGVMDIREPFYGPVGRIVKAIALPTDEAFASEPYIGPAKVTLNGSGTGAAAVALFDENTRTITGIKVVAPGSGYDAETTATIESADRTKKYECVVTTEEPSSTGAGLMIKGVAGVRLRAENTFRGPITVCGGTLTLEEPSGVDSVLNEDATIDVRAGATVDLGTKERVLKFIKGSGVVRFGAQLTVSNGVNLAVGDTLNVVNDSVESDCPLCLADGVKVNVTNLPEDPEELVGRQTLLSVTNGRIQYLGAVDLSGVDKTKWSVRLGSSAITVRKREGLAITIR